MQVQREEEGGRKEDGVYFISTAQNNKRSM